VSSVLSAARKEGRRRELVWAWLSLAALVIAWDRAARLDERASPPRVRIAHVVTREEAAHGAAPARVQAD